MFKHQIRVAYKDVTVGNHVFYGRYLDFLEVARNELFRSLGSTLLKLQGDGIIFPVVECSLKYHLPARYDDTLEIRISVSDLGKVQFVLNYQVFRDSALILTASTRHATTSLEEKPIRMPGEVFEALKKLTVQP
jgi:acyl-CoA thioester hydrolase